MQKKTPGPTGTGRFSLRQASAGLDQDDAEQRAADRDGGDRREEGVRKTTHCISPVRDALGIPRGAHGAVHKIPQLRNL